jgi:TonB-dependent SusC/RagA subfamily outer membrane receptor
MRTKCLIIIIFAACFSLTVSGQKEKSGSKSKKVFISGYVKDIHEKPIRGAVVLIDDNSTDVMTNEDGFYRVKVRPDAKKITIVALGSAFGETQIDGKTTINFILKEKDPSADEILANQKKNEADALVDPNIISDELTSPANRIDGRKEKYAAYKDIFEMIQGTVPGVQIINGDVRIQGGTDLSGNHSPAYAIDGRLVDKAAVNALLPSNVLSIEVLKGAATAAYGMSGANGVISIRLK